MKSKFPYINNSFLYLLVLSTFLFSCVGVKKFRDDTAMARDKDKKAFVQTTDGTIIEANEVVLRTPFLGKGTIELDKSTKIPLNDVVAYQNSSAYYRRLKGQFAPRIKKGLINVFLTTETYQEYSAPTGSGIGGRSGGWKTRTRTVYYLQKGDNAIPQTVTPKITKEYVKDYAPAMEYINQYEQTQKKVKTWSIINTAAVVGSLFLALQGVKNDEVTAAGYISVGLFAGGMVNGIVNKIRRVKNHKNLELAVDEYNLQSVRNKKTAK